MSRPRSRLTLFCLTALLTAVVTNVLLWRGGGDVSAQKKKPPPPPVEEEVTEEEEDEDYGIILDLEALESIGYVEMAFTDNPEDRGVTTHLDEAFDGLNLYTSRDRATAVLLDMDGNILHSWSDSTHPYSWMHVKMRPNGDLLVIAKDKYIARLDWDSKVLWRQWTRAHHDLTVGRRGGVLVLSRSVRQHPFGGATLPVLADHIMLFSSTGKRLRHFSIFPIQQKVIPAGRWEYIKKQVVDEGRPVAELAIPEGASDVTHTNSIEIIPKAIPGVAPAGSFLLSIRESNRIILTDPYLSKLLWSWGRGVLQKQHHATFLDNGHIMVFDNGVRRKRSRVLEINPVNGKIVWSYSSPDLFTFYRGAAQRLPNDNVLITESDSGHAIEVTRDGEVVWEFWNPDVTTHTDEPQRAAIYRLTRYERSYLERPLDGEEN